MGRCDVAVAGFLDDGDLADQHPDRVLDRDRVQGRVVGVEDNHPQTLPHLRSWPNGCTNPTNAVIGIMAGAVKAAGYRNAACQPS